MFDLRKYLTSHHSSSTSEHNTPKHNTKGRKIIGKIFNLNNLLKAIIIFLIGYCIRSFINTDVFKEFNTITSICYYSFMSYLAVIFGVFASEYRDIN